MANKWKQGVLGDLFTICRDAFDPAISNEVLPYVGLEHIGQGTLHLLGRGVSTDVTSTKSRFKPGDTLFGKLRPYFRKVFFPDFEGVCSTDITVLRAKGDTDPRFLFYRMASEEVVDAASAGDKGTRMPRADWDFLSKLPIPIPPPEVQREIGDILGALDDKIELNRRMNESLEAMARAIFKSWFVDFDPVRAKSARRDTGLPSDIAALFPDSFVDSELGKIPREWKISTIGAEFNLTMGQSPPGETYNEIGNGIPFYQGRTDFGFRYPTCRMFCTAPARMANPGDTLISVRAPVGDINMASEKCCIGRGIAAIRHKSGSRSYTHYLMQSLVEVFGEFEAGGTVFGCMNKADFQSIMHVVPLAQLIDQFEDLVLSIDHTIENCCLQSSNLADLRDGLLPQLLSGDISL